MLSWLYAYIFGAKDNPIFCPVAEVAVVPLPATMLASLKVAAPLLLPPNATIERQTISPAWHTRSSGYHLYVELGTNPVVFKFDIKPFEIPIP